MERLTENSDEWMEFQELRRSIDRVIDRELSRFRDRVCLEQARSFDPLLSERADGPSGSNGLETARQGESGTVGSLIETDHRLSELARRLENHLQRGPARRDWETAIPPRGPDDRAEA